MSQEIEERMNELPLLRNFAHYLKGVKLNWLGGLPLYDLMELYIGIVEGALSNRAGSIAFSFFMALFPFALFIFNLIPYIPIEGFQQDFLKFVSEGVPHTYAIENIVNDILHNSNPVCCPRFYIIYFLMHGEWNAILEGLKIQGMYW
jgi:membrane protein